MPTRQHRPTARCSAKGPFEGRPAIAYWHFFKKGGTLMAMSGDRVSEVRVPAKGG